MIDLGPHGGGLLTDPDGRQWQLRRRRLDPRTTRSMIRRTDIPVLIGESAGAILRWIPGSERESFAKEVHRYYGLPLNSAGSPTQYVGHEFSNGTGNRLLYIETWC